MKRTILQYLGMLLVIIILCLPVISCDGEDNPENPSPGNYTVKMEISCTVPNTCVGLANVEMAWLRPENTAEVDTKIVEKGERWAQTVIYEKIPEGPIGFSVYPKLVEEIEEGTKLTVEYTYSCKVSLMLDDKVVEHVSCEIPVSDTFKYDPTINYRLSERIIYTVTTKGIQKAEGNIEDYTDPEIENKVVDEDLQRITGKVHCFSLNEDATDDNFLYDNMLARFSQRLQWDGMPIGKGEFLFLYKNDIEKAPANVIAQSLKNGAFIIIDCLDSYSQFTGFCKSQGIFNPLGDEDRDVSHTMFIVANSTNGLSAPGNDKCRGIFYVLDAALEEDGTATDYEQGLMVDNAVNTINRVITTQPAQAALRTRSSGEDEGAQIFGFSDLTHTLPSTDFKGAFKDDKTDRTNVYGVEFDIWNAYNAKDDRNYYYILEKLNAYFEPCYEGKAYIKDRIQGPWENFAYCGWYAANMDIALFPAEPEVSGLNIHKTAVSDIDDVTAIDQRTPGKYVKWRFDFKAPKFKFKFLENQDTEIIEGALAGRTSFSAQMDYIISFPASVTPRVEMSLDVHLSTKHGQGGGSYEYLNHRTKKFKRTFSLPTVSML